MIRISIFYPNVSGSRFDFEYYVEKHMPRSIQLLSAHPGFRGVSVERGLGGATPGSDPTYSAVCHYLFESADAFMAAFTPHAAELQGDIPNYTNVAPVIQINEVLISK
jgi:uncharacterized protein (TIGR02118 family)